MVLKRRRSGQSLQEVADMSPRAIEQLRDFGVGHSVDVEVNRSSRAVFIELEKELMGKGPLLSPTIEAARSDVTGARVE